MLRWDDIELLRLVDELEEVEPARLWNGLSLLQKAGEGKTSQLDQEAQPFARELLLARDAGYLQSVERNRTIGANPLGNAHSWLQDIGEIHLTIAGRVEPAGRVVLVPLPDSAEDDGRLIAGVTLEEIARTIAEMYRDTQLPRFLIDSGIPGELVSAEVEGSKTEWLLRIFEQLEGGGSAYRRVLREFIGGWLDGRYAMPPAPDAKKLIVAYLGQQGWHITDGRLVIGDTTFDAAGKLTPLGRDVRIAALHVDIQAVANKYVETGHLGAAVFEALKAVTNKVKAMTGVELEGVPLINHVFSEKAPWLVLADLTTQTGKDIQAGYRYLFVGAVQAIRNPNAHEAFEDLDQEEGLEALAFASMLMRRLDVATIVQQQ